MAKKTQMELSLKAQELMSELLVTYIEYEEKIEVLRQFLCSNELFDLYSAFNRIDRTRDGFITPMKLINFMRDNGVTTITESQCYFMIKYFDSDLDGKLHFPDFMQIILPCTNSTMRSEVTQRMQMDCPPDQYLRLDVEQDMVRLFKMELELHYESEAIKQKFECMPETSMEVTFACLDSSKIGFLESKSFLNFFKQQGIKMDTD